MKLRSLLLGALLGATAHSHATVLTFDITPAPASGSFIPQDYGDRVTGPIMISGPSIYNFGAAGGFTPNVVVSYGGGGLQPNTLNFWGVGYSDLTNVIENDVDNDNELRVSFTADPGFLVRLDSFDIGNWSGALTVPAIRVTNGIGNELYSDHDYALAASTGPHQSVTFGGGIAASQLNLIVDLTGLAGASDNVGLDNIQFAQIAAVPEPSTYALMIAGLGFVGFVAHRRRKGSAAAAA